ncbi:ABC transporter ATP-binding protein [Mesorhizobium sp. 1M-11]|uniref:dipeptide ABC transporter ATP-binding protein n=1 Tax=Mesorhizobium sp. 1M-11 TaxID=1529006 RepID=UPI0006C7384A|nr:ABC transporter ATP-binding protein [Mesorhizobium sp. 1M-11]
MNGPVTPLVTGPLLDVIDVSVRFGNTRVLKNVSFQIMPGEIVGIAGESGSGKSTICRGAMGLLPSTAEVTGEVRFKDQALLGLGEADWAGLRGRDMAMIFQNPASHLNPLQKVGKQIAQPMIRHLGLSASEAWDKAVRLLEDVGIREPAMRAKSYPHELSGGMKQRVMIAAAISCAPRLLIADEPTTALDVTVQAKILELLKDLNRQRGLAIALISHDLGVLADICSRIMVMRHGEIVEQGEAGQIIDAPQHPYTRLLVDSQPGRKQFKAGWKQTEGQAPLLQVENLRVVFPGKRDIVDILRKRKPTPFAALDGVNLAIDAGETVGIVGESGSGKSTLARAIIRQNRPASGTVKLDGSPIERLAGRDLLELRRRVQMVFQNPYDSLNPRMTALETIAEPIWRHGMADRRSALSQASKLLDMVELPAALGERKPRQLSGGQCQRVGIARALALQPQVLIADEITSALDVTTQAQILELLARLRRERALTLVYISHDLFVVSSFCQRVYVFRSGRIVEQGAAADVLTSPKEAYTRELVASLHRLPRQVRESIEG